MLAESHAALLLARDSLAATLAGIEMKGTVWNDLWLSLSGCLTTNRAKELQFKINHRLHITPVRRIK